MSNDNKDLVQAEKQYKKALKLAYKSPLDADKVIATLNSAIALGSADAAFALGTWYLQGVNVETDIKLAEELLEFAAKKNHPIACFDYAILMEKSERFNDALIHYTKAALYGENESLIEVGRMYFHGIGCEPNPELAEVWYQKAETLGLIVD